MSVESESTDARETEAKAGGGGDNDSDGEGGGHAVRHARVNAASEKYGEEDGSGVKEMNTPGAKVGERIRMYQPRFGRCMVQ